jgi:ABC-type transport system involved in multi-copper enzyme maturation permease subunit
MRNIWLSLAWKEWHEHKWKLAAMTAIVCSANAALLRWDFVSNCYWVTLICMLPLAVFIGASTAASERSRSTDAFLEALPVQSWKPALNKLVAGLISLALVTAFALLFVYAVIHCWKLIDPHAKISLVRFGGSIGPPLHVSNWYVNSSLTIILATVSLFLWTIAIGANRPDEVGAGARSILVTTVWWTLFGVWFFQFDEKAIEGPTKLIVATLVAMSPGGASVVFPKNQSLVAWAGTWLPVVCGLLVHFGLAAWFLWRFERPGRALNFSLRLRKPVEPQSYWPRAPWRSQFGAIAWKQLRESGLAVLAGLAGIVALTGLVIVGNSRQFYWWFSFAAIAGVYATVTAMFGFVIAVVVGIGLSHNDASPRINTFWRSRPIPPDRWYMVKLFTGLAELFVALFLPVLLLAALGHLVGYDQVWDRLWDRGAMIVVASVVMMYVSAILLMMLLRHAVYAAILSVGVLFATYFSIAVVVAIGRWALWREPLKIWRDMSLDNWPTFVGLLIATGVVVMIGLIANRRDWGWKSGY